MPVTEEEVRRAAEAAASARSLAEQAQRQADSSRETARQSRQRAERARDEARAAETEADAREATAAQSRGEADACERARERARDRVSLARQKAERAVTRAQGVHRRSRNERNSSTDAADDAVVRTESGVAAASQMLESLTACADAAQAVAERTFEEAVKARADATNADERADSELAQAERDEEAAREDQVAAQQAVLDAANALANNVELRREWTADNGWTQSDRPSIDADRASGATTGFGGGSAGREMNSWDLLQLEQAMSRHKGTPPRPTRRPPPPARPGPSGPKPPAAPTKAPKAAAPAQAPPPAEPRHGDSAAHTGQPEPPTRGAGTTASSLFDFNLTGVTHSWKLSAGKWEKAPIFMEIVRGYKHRHTIGTQYTFVGGLRAEEVGGIDTKVTIVGDWRQISKKRLERNAGIKAESILGDVEETTFAGTTRHTPGPRQEKNPSNFASNGPRYEQIAARAIKEFKSQAYDKYTTVRLKANSAKYFSNDATICANVINETLAQLKREMTEHKGKCTQLEEQCKQYKIKASNFVKMIATAGMKLQTGKLTGKIGGKVRAIASSLAEFKGEIKLGG